MGRKRQDEAINSALTRKKRAGAAEIVKNSHCSHPVISCQKHRVSASPKTNPPHRAATFLGFNQQQNFIFHEDHTSNCLVQSASTSKHHSSVLCSEPGCAPDKYFCQKCSVSHKKYHRDFFPTFQCFILA